MSNSNVTYGSRERSKLHLPHRPEGVRFTRYKDGFKTDVPMGNYFTGGALVGGALFMAFLLGSVITSPFSWIAIASGGFLGWRGIHKLLGELSIYFRDGRIHIKEGVLGLGINEAINVSEIRSVKRVQIKQKLGNGGKKEQIEITTTSKSIMIGKHLNRTYRDFVYNTLVFYLDKSMHRIS